MKKHHELNQRCPECDKWNELKKTSSTVIRDEIIYTCGCGQRFVANVNTDTGLVAEYLGY